MLDLLNLFFAISAAYMTLNLGRFLYRVLKVRFQGLRILHVAVQNDRIYLAFNTDEFLSLPWCLLSTRLADATPEQARDIELIGRGTGLHWPQLDEDLSAEGIHDLYVSNSTSAK